MGSFGIHHARIAALAGSTQHQGDARHHTTIDPGSLSHPAPYEAEGGEVSSSRTQHTQTTLVSELTPETSAVQVLTFKL